MTEGDYTIKDIYQGGYSSLSPSYGNVFTGYRVAAGNLGLTTDPRTANILQETSSKLSTGVKQIELSTVSPEIFESIPKQHLKEINRLSKLTGIDVSVHAPIVEPSGMTKEGFTELGREAVERQMNSVVERSNEINPQGNVPVTFHSSAILPGQVKKRGKKEPEEIFIINSESGSINKLPLRKRSFPKEGEVNVEQELEKVNERSWDQNLSNLSYNTRYGRELFKQSEFLKKTAEGERKAGKELVEVEKEARANYNMGAAMLDDSYRQIKEIFETVKRYGTKEDQKIIDQFSQQVESDAEKIKKTKDRDEQTQLTLKVIEECVETFGKIKIPPKIYRELDEFAKENTIKTFANVALNSYKKFGDKAPIITIENPPIGQAFSTGEELKGIVEESRKKFVETAVKEGMSENEAKSQAEKLLGVTWDVGHINMLKKYGYEAEHIIKETEQVAKLVKHVHLSDNFGFEHTELPMGMGNVPIKEIMEKLGKEGFDAKKIVEAASWWQHFKTPPVQETLHAFGSPLYSMGMAPYWNQTLGLQQGYFSGYGMMLPQINYETFGAGFSQLPAELGGQKPGAEGSRMSGKPME